MGCSSSTSRRRRHPRAKAGKSLGTAEYPAPSTSATAVVSADPFVGYELYPIAALPGYLESAWRAYASTSFPVWWR
jgi:hypothetical protein